MQSRTIYWISQSQAKLKSTAECLTYSELHCDHCGWFHCGQPWLRGELHLKPQTTTSSEAPFSSKLGPSVGFGSWPLFLICRRSHWLIEISGSVLLLNWICQNEIMVTETKDMEKILTRRRSIPVKVDQWNFFTGIKGHLYPKWATNKQVILNSSRTNSWSSGQVLFTEASTTFVILTAHKKSMC